MSRRAPWPAALLALTAAACAHAAHGMLRVDLERSDAVLGSPLEAQLVETVNGAAAAEGLACRPGTGADLLRCTAASVGSGSHGLVVSLRRSGTGHAVTIDQQLRLPGMSSPVCEVQARIAGRIAAALGPPVVKVDARSGCKSVDRRAVPAGGRISRAAPGSRGAAPARAPGSPAAACGGAAGSPSGAPAPGTPRPRRATGHRR